MKEFNASPGGIIQLGYEGEDNVTKIVFRYDESWLSYGEGEFKIRVLRSCDTEAYNATEVTDDRESMTLTMTVTDIELSVKGHGEMQMVYIGSDFVKKSPIYRYNVFRAIDSEIVDPPQGSIITEVEESLAEIQDEIGDLADLTTTDKSSLVSAINEVNAKEVEVVTDSEMSDASENPVQNKAIKEYVDNAVSHVTIDVDSELSDESENPVQNKVVTAAISEVNESLQTLTEVIEGTGQEHDSSGDDYVSGLFLSINKTIPTANTTDTSGVGVYYFALDEGVTNFLLTLSGTNTRCRYALCNNPLSDLTGMTRSALNLSGVGYDFDSALPISLGIVNTGGTYSALIFYGGANAEASLSIPGSGTGGVATREELDELSATVAGIGGRLATAETSLEGKANTSDVNTALALKANSADVQTALAGKANTADMNTALSAKANTSDMNTALALKANSSDVQTALAGKANTDVATTSANGLMSSADKTKLDGLGNSGVSDVQINGTSIVSDGVAEIPIADNYKKIGLFSINELQGLTVDAQGGVGVRRALLMNEIKSESQTMALTPSSKGSVAFYGLAKAAGDTTQSASSNAVGQYTEEAKASIRTMLGLQDVYEDYSSALTALGVIEP